MVIYIGWQKKKKKKKMKNPYQRIFPCTKNNKGQPRKIYPNSKFHLINGCNGVELVGGVIPELK